MKLLAVVASTLFFVLISQQFTSALPVDETRFGFTTEFPHVEHAEREFDESTSESPLVETKRASFASLEEPESGRFQQQTQQHTQQIQQTIEERGFVDFTTEFPSTESEHHTIESSGFNKVHQHAEHPHSVENVNEKTKRGTNEGTDDEDDEEAKKREETEEHTEEKKPVKEEKPKEAEAKDEEEKTEEHVEEEKPKKVKEEKSESSEFCPENYVKFEDSCLFVGPKGKVSARSGKVPISKTDSSLVENFPVNEDNSCPPGTVHTERGVCQKTLTEAEAKAKKVAHSCPENAEFVNGQCIFHSFDLTNSTMQAPLETSERPEVSPVEPIGTATESKSIIESEFPTTMQSVLKS